MVDKIALTPQTISTPAKIMDTSTTGVDISNQFSDFLNEAMDKTKDQSLQVDQLTKQFITGDLTDVHQLMIASQKASLGLELTVQVRDKVIEAYKEIMRIQI